MSMTLAVGIIDTGGKFATTGINNTSGTGGKISPVVSLMLVLSQVP
jgi:hypothetical protein